MRRNNKPTTTRRASNQAAASTLQGYRNTNRTARTDATRRAAPYTPRAPPASMYQQGPEIKAIDIPSAAYVLRNPGTASNIILLNGVQTGAGFFNRVGSRIEMKSLHFRGPLTALATGVQTHGRILIVYDRQPTGALPVIADILQARDQAGAATTTSVSEINLDNRDRFTIIRDMTFFLPSQTYTAAVLTNGPNYPTDSNDYDINEFVKLKGLTTHFKSSTNPTAIADISTGALYACFVSGGTDSAWNTSMGFRLRYNDV